MWLLKLSLATLWMMGMTAGWTFGGLLHVLALVVVAMEFLQGTRLEQKIRRVRASTRIAMAPREAGPTATLVAR